MIKEYKKLHIDVGANEGKFCINSARFNPDTFVIAFEPIPQLVESILEQTSNLKNIKVIQSAISDEEGIKELNISPTSFYGDYACSSFLKFSDKSKTEWKGRDDFKVINQIDVNLIRLDNFFIANDITKVDYLKIDTQGYDLRVLKSCGDMLSIICKGEMEAATKNNILYYGQNTKDECIQFLEANNFKILDIVPNDIYNNEVNIIFENINPKQVIYKKSYNII